MIRNAQPSFILVNNILFMTKIIELYFFQTYRERILFMHPLKLSRIPTTSQVFEKKFLHLNVDKKPKQTH
jgi:hypothetical protein